LHALDGVTAWENTFHRLGPGVSQGVIAARELADGTSMTVVADGNGMTALRYDHSGVLQSSATFFPVYANSGATIDPFGAVYVEAQTSPSLSFETDLWYDKYDGLTGQALWPAGVTYGAGNHKNDTPSTAFFVDPAGDLVVGATDDSHTSITLLKYSGLDGSVVWGPITTPVDQYSYVAATLDAAGDLYFAYRSATGPVFHLGKRSGATGALLWQHDEAGHDLEPGELFVDGSGNVVTMGSVGSGATSFEADKYSGETGQRIWGPAIHVAAASTFPISAAVGPDGSTFVYALTLTTGGQISVLVLKFRGADGAREWGPVSLPPPPLGQGTFYVGTGVAGNGDLVVSAPYLSGSTFVTKSWRLGGADGSIVWGPQSVNLAFGGMFVASNGRVFLSGGAGTNSDPEVQTTELQGATGIPAWGPATFSGAGAGFASLGDLTTSPDGSAIATGAVEGPGFSGSWATLKYDRITGALVWGPVFFDSGNGVPPKRVLTSSSGDVLIAGTSSGGMTVVKYEAATGGQLWASTVAPAAFLQDFALLPSGNVVITGFIQNGANYDVVTAKLSGSSGATLWGPIVYDSGGDDYPDRMTVDPSANVVLAGHSVGLPGFLLKYAGVDGAVLWGPIAGDSFTAGLACDSAGDILQVGADGITTTKLSGATGSTLWGPVTVSGSQAGAALALDAAGDVVVTGTMDNGTNTDYGAIKYHGGDGSVFWGPVTYDGGGNDIPFKVVVDGSGNAVVTGTSAGGSDQTLAATFSYDGATGALRWGPVFRPMGSLYAVSGLAASGSTVYVGASRDDLGYVVDAIDETLGITTLPGALPAVACGHAIDIPLGAANGTPPYAWSIVGGGLPPAVVLVGGGDIIGMPAEEGTYTFTVQVQDSALATVTRDFSLTVGPSGPLVPVTVTRDPATCQLTLSVAGSYAAYDWLPDGQSTPTITVDPTEPTPYGVILNDGSTCAVRGAVAIVPFDPTCLSPTLGSIAPTSGPATGTPVTVQGSRFDPSVALSIGGQPATGVVFESPLTLAANTPLLGPATVADVLVVNPDGRYGFLPRAFASDFLDVSSSNIFYADIMKVLRAGITAGCGSGNYCYLDSVSRSQMAVFMLKAEHGFFYVPPPCTGVFADVPCPGGFAVNWIEELAAEGVTGGCGGGNYCPDAAVTRAQMSTFLLKAEHGASYSPPPCAGIFGDVACPGPFADWIEQLFHEGITGGCGNGNYCPASPNTRGQMAVFLAKTFSLP
jgi:hypothetical protein